MVIQAPNKYTYADYSSFLLSKHKYVYYFYFFLFLLLALILYSIVLHCPTKVAFIRQQKLHNVQVTKDT